MECLLYNHMSESGFAGSSEHRCLAFITHSVQRMHQIASLLIQDRILVHDIQVTKNNLTKLGLGLYIATYVYLQVHALTINACNSYRVCLTFGGRNQAYIRMPGVSSVE